MNRIILLCFSLVLFTQCEDYFKTQTDDTLSSDKYIKSVDELYSGFRGIASKVQDVADQAIFVSELRGDLLEPTVTAPQELWDIYNFQDDTTNNSLTNPKGYYNVIINANDFIIKALKFKKDYPTAVEDGVFQPLISGAIRFKCWAYLMLAKTYGKAVYFDDALTEFADISKYETLDFDALIQRCLTLMDVGQGGINGNLTLTYKTILSSTDLTWDMICPSSEVLLAELNLWAGNYQNVVDIVVPFLYDNGSKTRYKLTNKFYNGEWRLFFRNAPTTTTDELITVVPYDYSSGQTNRLNQYFCNTFSNKYYLKPTQVAMDRFNKQTQFTDASQINDKYRGDGTTFDEVNGEYVITKFSYNYQTSATWFLDDAPIVLYRASDMHFFLAEALNHLELFPEAEAILNDGLANYLSTYVGYLRAPFNNATYNTYFVSNLGIRRRVNLSPAIQSKASLLNGVFTDTLKTQSDTLAYKKAFDLALVEETCMESAGEARSYFAMIRASRRWGVDVRQKYAAQIASKYSDGGAGIQAKLEADIKNWFVKYDLGN